MRAAIGQGGAVTDLLVERARRGDADAFVALIEERQVAMARVATAILGNEADAADALQETLVSLWRELPRLRSVERFPAWADAILVNACRLVLRRRARTRVRQVPLDGGLTDEVRLPVRRGPEAEVADRDAFDRAFEALSIDARAVLVLHHLEGRSIAAIAVALGIPSGTVKSRLFAARRGPRASARARSAMTMSDEELRSLIERRATTGADVDLTAAARAATTTQQRRRGAGSHVVALASAAAALLLAVAIGGPLLTGDDRIATQPPSLSALASTDASQSPTAWTNLVWEQESSDAFKFAGKTYVTDGIATGNGFLAIGYTIDGDAVTARIWRTPDGRSWHAVAGDWLASARLNEVLMLGSEFVVIGAHGDGTPAVWWSADGEAWEEHTPDGFEYLAYDRAAVGASGLLLSATGRAGSFWFIGDSDLRWARLDANWPQDVRIFSITSGDEGWIATGATGAGSAATMRVGGTVGGIWTSADAVTWTPATVDQPGGLIMEVARVEGGYVALGSDAGLRCDGCMGGPISLKRHLVTWLSAEGLTWRRTGAIEVGMLNVGDSVVVGGGLVAAGNGRVLVFESTADGRLRVRQTIDGIAWSDVGVLHLRAAGGGGLDVFPYFRGPVIVGQGGMVAFGEAPNDPEATSTWPLLWFGAAAQFSTDDLVTFDPRPEPILNDQPCPNQEPCGP
jgi:RNA polymerase sigma-70 factor (ECF subfamily)